MPTTQQAPEAPQRITGRIGRRAVWMAAVIVVVVFGWSDLFS